MKMPRRMGRDIDTNVMGSAICNRSVVPSMVARGRWTRHQSWLDRCVYHVWNGAFYARSKAAEKSISEGLKIDSDGNAGRVTSVAPGWSRRTLVRCDFAGTRREPRSVSEHYGRCSRRMLRDAIVWAASRPAHVIFTRW